jgi:hypothetical protein
MHTVRHYCIQSVHEDTCMSYETQFLENMFHSLLFFYSREKILCVDDFITLLFVVKKVLKIRFLKYGRVVNTRRSVLLYIYIYIYIYMYI